MDHFRRLWRRKKRVLAENRFFFIGHAIPEGAIPVSLEYPPQKFPDNEIISSKYTIWNFLPKNLFEQFRRIANFYFLCVAIIQMVSDSPTSPMTSLLPLIFVVVVTAIKQGYEDFLRHKSDRQVNHLLIDGVLNGQLQKTKSKHIHVGDVIRIEQDESFPCDLVLLSSSNHEGSCYITTANLDGETNYKIKNSPMLTRNMHDPSSLDSLRAHIECQQPTVNLYQFIGKLTVYSSPNQSASSSASVKSEALGVDNLLLRGARLKDTDFIYGCAVYTGQDTKLGLNSLLTTNKFSTVEKSMNYFLLVFLGLLIVEISLCTMQKYLFLPNLSGAFYLQTTSIATASEVWNDLASFLILFNYVIPISLYVTLELQKFLGSLFFAWDLELYCPVIKEHAICNTSDLNEELGQVQYLLTDKTGTLTENCMEFRQCSVGGQKYIEESGALRKAIDDSTITSEPVEYFSSEEEQFLTALALCHTLNVIGKIAKKKEANRSPSNNNGGVDNAAFELPKNTFEYQASSPDEKALAEACQRFGVVYCGEDDGVCTISVKGEYRQYRKLHVLEFDSDRKRMSVLVRFPDASIWLLCKGAESSVLPLCNTEVAVYRRTEQHIKDYALLGLRTLTIAARCFSEEEYLEINYQLIEARQALTDREGSVARIFNTIESSLTLLGATGVEDQLQDGVAETLESLKVAGICIWVLTGDKMETAVNIAFSCGHFKRTMNILEMSGTRCTEEMLLRFKKQVQEGNGNHFGFVIDGQCLALALRGHRTLLTEVAMCCEAVVCCRMSPIQKAEVVKLVKSFPTKPITAAIGDGANDVSMIQEAHIGLGIMGKEGRQAVCCSDFAFARFRFLRKVLLVHGHWYYWRVSTLVEYFFYKNLAFITPTVFFCIFSAYSTQPLYDSFFLTYYNILFTSLPILVFGLLEQNYTSEQLLSNLHLYKNISRNARMSWGQFFKWNLLGLWHSVAIFFGCMLLCQSDPAFVSSGQTLDYHSFGTLVYHEVIFIVSFKLMMESRYWTAFFMISILLSVLGFMGLTFLYSAFTIDALGNGPMLWVYMNMLSTGSVWLFVLFISVGSLIPDLLVALYETYSSPNGAFLQSSHRLSADRDLPILISMVPLEPVKR